jgi:hypothetical protein
MLAYSLKDNISIEKLQRDINYLISKNQEPNSDMILYINIKKISYDNIDMIPKIEHKSLDQDAR